jgi:hypothetical protein
MKYVGKCIGGPLNGQMLTRESPLFDVTATKDPFPLSPEPIGKVPLTVKSVTYKFIKGPRISFPHTILAYDFWIAVDEMPGLDPAIQLFRMMMEDHPGRAIDD